MTWAHGLGIPHGEGLNSSILCPHLGRHLSNLPPPSLPSTGPSKMRMQDPEQGVSSQRVLTALSPFPEALGQLSSASSIPKPALPSCSIHIGTVRELGLWLRLEEEKSCMAGSHRLQQNVIPVHEQCSGDVWNLGVLWTNLMDPPCFTKEKLRQGAETWLSGSRCVGR